VFGDIGILGDNGGIFLTLGIWAILFYFSIASFFAFSLALTMFSSFYFNIS